MTIFSRGEISPRGVTAFYDRRGINVDRSPATGGSHESIIHVFANNNNLRDLIISLLNQAYRLYPGDPHRAVSILGNVNSPASGLIDRNQAAEINPINPSRVIQNVPTLFEQLAKYKAMEEVGEDASEVRAKLFELVEQMEAA